MTGRTLAFAPKAGKHLGGTGCQSGGPYIGWGFIYSGAYMRIEAEKFLRELFAVAVASARAERCLPAHLPPPPAGRTVVVGAGKAAAAMARVVEASWVGPLSGQVVTAYGHGLDCSHIKVREAGHPVPDAAGVVAAQGMLASVAGLNSQDLVLCLLSGGGSSLMPLPARGISLEEKCAINRALLRSGAPVGELNCVRKHLSAIKGGRLAIACAPAPVYSLMISDVCGDDPSTIASGPTVADASTCQDALEILATYHIDIPDSVRVLLEGGESETPKPGDPRFNLNQTVIVANADEALKAAARVANNAGTESLVLGADIEGEARLVARQQAEIVMEIRRRKGPVSPPCVILSGGETTVTVRGSGKGGRNGEFLLSLAIALDGMPGVYAIACDTDGIDGMGNNAGALLYPDSLDRSRRNPRESLANNDSDGFFGDLGDQVITGPTRTNVNDFRAILIT